MYSYNKNLSYYFNLLPPHEQLKEINEMITCFSTHTHSRHQSRMNFTKVMRLKSIKKDILSRMHVHEKIVIFCICVRYLSMGVFFLFIIRTNDHLFLLKCNILCHHILLRRYLCKYFIVFDHHSLLQRRLCEYFIFVKHLSILSLQIITN